MIRQADINDKRAVTGLHYMAGPNLINFFFVSDKKKEVISILDFFYDTRNNIFSKDIFFVLEEENKTKGAIALYTGKDKKRLETNTLKLIFKILKIAGTTRLIKMIYRLSFYNLSPKFYSDELYIHAISVLPQYRGQKIASKLLKHAFIKAKELNIPKVALLVEIQNEHAINVYNKYGFKITTTQKFNPILEKHKLYGIHKMVAKVKVENEH